MFVAHDRGGANALISLLQSKDWTAEWHVDFLFLGPAKSAYAEFLLGKVNYASLSAIDWGDYQLILTGSSNIDDLERQAWQTAKKYGTKTICLIDSWTNLVERFQFYQSKILSLPDVINVIDGKSAKFLMTELPQFKGELVIGGQPFLESIQQPQRKEKVTQQNTILFCSEPMLEGYNQTGALGYDQYSVFSNIVKQLSLLPFASKILLKLHPAENKVNWQNFLSQLPALENVSIEWVEGNLNEYFNQVNAVVGLVSMALLEAALSGVKTISCQFDRQFEVAPEVVQFSQVITNPDEFLPILQDNATAANCDALNQVITASSKRVVKMLKQQLCSTLTIRDAQLDDGKLVFNWANDLAVREMAFNSDQIDWQDHLKWFTSRLNDEQTRIYIACLEGQAVGQVRLELVPKQNAALLDYSISANFRGMGLATRMLMLADKQALADAFCSHIIAEVKLENTGSHKALLAAGYQLQENTSEIKRYRF